jgi:hypothetical protein
MASGTRVAVVLALVLAVGQAIDLGAVRRGQGKNEEVMSKNPIRKVVTLLENMAKKVTAEGEKEKDLFEKFQCYCRTGGSDLQASIQGNNAKVPAVQSDIEEAQSTLAQLKIDLKGHQTDRASAKEAMAAATSVRDQEHTKFLAESTELKGYVNALASAIPAIMEGMAGTAASALQLGTATADTIRKAIIADQTITEDDRDAATAFLSGGASSTSGYVPVGGEIMGILNTMKDDFDKNLAEVEGEEAEAVKLFDNLIAAKTKEVHTLTTAIEVKTGRVGELGVNIVQMKADLTEAEAMLIADNKFLGDLEKDCANKQKEWDERQKMRAEEINAIHETIKILNDDDALDLFKKTLPSASLLQLDAGKQSAQQKVIDMLRKNLNPTNKVRPEIRFLEMALMGKKVDFSKVIKMIDDMVALLKQEQYDDDNKQEYCRLQIDNVEDKGKDLAKSVNTLEVSIEDRTEAITQFADELKTLQAEITELDKLVLEATEQRKKENEEYTELMSDNGAAKELLEYAKNRLQKFYNPKLYKPPPKRELSEQDQIAVNMGGTAPPTPAPGGIAGSGVEAALVQIRAHNVNLADPGPRPETFEGDYGKKTEESGGVLAMIDLLIRDLTKEMTVAETEEEGAQKEYEGFMQDSAGKRAKTVKGISIKEASKADNEMLKTKEEGDLTAQTGMLQATKIYEHQLHAECDWLIQNFDLRKTARAEESENLKSAKAVLSGADFGGALVQKKKTLLSPA